MTCGLSDEHNHDDEDETNAKAIVGCLSDRILTALNEGLVLHGLDPSEVWGEVLAQQALEAAMAVQCRGAAVHMASNN